MDGLFRNLLVDVTGNTHRAEFCIDKLYPPPGLGLSTGPARIAAFEMAPECADGPFADVAGPCPDLHVLESSHSREAWYAGGRRFTTVSCCLILSSRTFLDVLAQLRQSGYLILKQNWFAAHLEFRFPTIGSISADGVELELRRALEPWNVLAEETTSGRTVRSVDSSVERLQVKISGATTESRYVVACNGRKVPLQPTNASRELRWQAYVSRPNLSEDLAPLIPVHAPLTFALIDRFNIARLAMCYHVKPPTRARILDGRLMRGGTEPACRAISEVNQPSRLDITARGRKNPSVP